MTNVYPAPVTEERLSYGRLLRLTNLMMAHAERGHHFRASYYRARIVVGVIIHERAFGPIVKR